MRTSRLKVDSTLGDILHHPAFAGFARHLLPWDDSAYDERLRLTDIRSLLPYHTHIDPEVIASSLNRMIDDVGSGSAIFYDLYSDAEKQADATRKNAALFYFRGKPGAPFCVIAPGGGFAYVGSVHEGFPYANEISKLGYNAFVLKYRAGHGEQVATADMAVAISHIFRNAAKLKVNTAGYSLWGSSGGARMAAAIGSHGTARFGGPDLPKPSAVVMAYTGHTEVSAYEPPTFVVVGEQDAIARPSTMRRRVDALRRAGTEVEYHEYHGLGHGFGLGAHTGAEGWVSQAVRFWARQLEMKNQQLGAGPS